MRMRRRLQSFTAVILTLVLGNALLSSYFLHVLRQEGAERLLALRQDQENEIIAEVRGRVDSVCSMIREIAKTGRSEEEAQRLAMDAVSSIRFGENNYVWIHRLDPKNIKSAFMLVHPSDDLRGRDQAGLIDMNQITSLYYGGEIIPKSDSRVKNIEPVELFTEFNRKALEQGEGIVSYYWPKILNGKASPEGYRKVAFIKYLKEWNWVVGAGAYADSIDLAVKKRSQEFATRHARLVGTAGAAVAFFTILVVVIVAVLTLGTMRDQVRELKMEIGERTRAEAALRQVSTLQRAMLENAGYAIMAATPEGVITTFNPAATQMLGYRADEVVGLTTPLLFHEPEEVAARARQIAAELGIPLPSGIEVFLVEPRLGLVNEREWTYIRKDGTRFPVLLSVTAMRDERDVIAGFLGIAVDISERKQTEEQLRQAQKMESVGRLAAGIAHDFNNLLSPILGYAELLLMDIPPSSDVHEQLHEIKAAAERARDLTRQLLSFGRRQVLQLKPIDLNQVVGGMERLVQRTLREDIKMRVHLETAPCRVLADIGQLEQVIMNLVVNAQDAMKKGGALTIRTSRVFLNEAHPAHTSESKVGYYCVLSVSDTGCGIASDIKGQIFEPFFSTKGELGTGLGLATVYGVVKQHGGNVLVNSELGRGTTFEIYLAESTETPSAAFPETVTRGDFRGSETILVVEDNDMVRRFVRTILSRHGYNVLCAANGREALRMLDEHTTPLHLLLTDVIMPEMNGKDLFLRVSKERPGLEVLYMSGYTEDVIGHHGVLDAGINFIGKPFKSAALLAKVREALQAAGQKKNG